MTIAEGSLPCKDQPHYKDAVASPGGEPLKLLPSIQFNLAS